MMNFLFWCLWIADALLLLLAIAGAKFRSGFGAGTDLNTVVTIVLAIILISSLALRFSFKQKGWSLVIVGAPMLVVSLMYILEMKSK